jgi:DNA polymerase III delta prime subunit
MQHHAYYIEDSTSLFDAYKAALRPFWSKKFERFGVDEARELIALASLKNFNAPTYFIGAASITSEAQQALLKLLEEPQEGTTFVLLVPQGALLPTVKSRMQAKQLEIERDETSVKKFLGMSGKDRSAEIAKMLKDKDEEGTKEIVRDFVNALEVELHKKIADPKVRVALEDVAKVRDYLGDRSPSLKMLLEHLALSLPRI